MKNRRNLGRGVAILACAASLAGTAALAPTAASAATSCGNKSIKIPVEGGKAEHIPVKAVTVEGGATCPEAVKVIGDLFGGSLPKGWVSKAGNFEPPEGLIAQELKKGSKKIKYAVRGG